MKEKTKRIKNYNLRRILLTSFLLVIIILPSYTIFLNMSLVRGDSNEEEDAKTTSQNKTFDTPENTPSTKSMPIATQGFENYDEMNYRPNSGEFFVDVDFNFDINLPVLEWVASEHNWVLEDAEMTIALVDQYWEGYSSIEHWSESGTFILGSTNLVPTLRFHFIGYWWMPGYPYGEPGHPDLPNLEIMFYLRIPDLGQIRYDLMVFGTYFGFIEASVYRNANCSITYNPPYVENNNPYEVNITINKNGATDVSNVILERKITGAGDWQNATSWEDIDFGGVDQKTLTFVEDGSLNPTGENQEIFYRVFMEGSHFRYRSQQNRIMVNATKPFISEFSVILEHEFYDKGVINPTEVFSIKGNIINPNNNDVHNVRIEFNRYLSGLEEDQIVFKDVGTLTAGQKKEFVFSAPNLSDITPTDTPFLIPGWNYTRIDEPDIELTYWNWYNLLTGEIISTSRNILFHVWILGDEDDTKLLMNLTAYVPMLKIYYAKEIQVSYRRLVGYINLLNRVKGLNAPMVWISATVQACSEACPDPWNILAEGVGFILIGIEEAIRYEEYLIGTKIAAVLNNIQENILRIIKDPPDPNIYDVVDIEFEPIEPFDEKFEFARNLYDSYATYTRFEDITRAIKITNDRYMYAIMNGEYAAAKLQAEALKNFTQLQANYYNSYLMNLEGIFDNFTLKAIITDIGFDFDEAVLNFTIFKEFFLNRIEFCPELRQLFIDEGYTNEDIEEMITVISDFDLNAANQEVEQEIDDFNYQARLSVSNGTEIIEGLISGVEELARVPETPDFKAEFKTASNKFMDIMELRIDSTKKEVVNGETLAFNITLSNLLEQSVVYNIKIEDLDDFEVFIDNIETTPDGIELLFDALETREVLVEVEIPINEPPNILNPEVIASSVYMEKSFIKSQSILISVNDDDVTPPLLLLSHAGDSTDENPGIIELDFSDTECEATAKLLIIGPNDYIYWENYLIEGTYSLDLTQIQVTELGEYNVILYAENNDEDGWDGDEGINTIFLSFVIEDDDVTAPILSLSHIGGDTDGDVGTVAFDINDPDFGSDATAILSILDNAQNIIYTNEFSEGFYALDLTFLDLGQYIVKLDGENNDEDRLNDEEYSTQSITLIIIDDDTTAPMINIQYFGGGTDGNQGYFEWTLVDYDDGIGGDQDTGFSIIDVKINYESTEGLPNKEIILPASESGTWNLNPYLGKYTITILAQDNDDDRTLIIDALSAEISEEQEIYDDDTSCPEIFNLIVEDQLENVHISFTTLEESGIDEIIINIDGSEVVHEYPLISEDTFNYIIPNEWITNLGVHNVNILVRDADNDRESDSLLTEVFETFETMFDELKQYVTLEINELIQEIQDSSDDSWRKKNNKATLINKLNELKEMIPENDFEEAYDKLLHDIKPKLTGLKTDENENPWGNGVFKNPWVNSLELQEIFRVFCNEILTDITVLIQTVSTMEYTGLNYFNTYSSIGLDVNGMGGIYGYNIFLLIGLISIIPLFSYFRRKKK